MGLNLLCDLKLGDFNFVFVMMYCSILVGNEENRFLVTSKALPFPHLNKNIPQIYHYSQHFHT